MRTRKPAVRRAVSNAPARERVAPQSDKVPRIIEPSTLKLRGKPPAPRLHKPCVSVVTGQSAKAVSCPPCLFLHKFCPVPSFPQARPVRFGLVRQNHLCGRLPGAGSRVFADWPFLRWPPLQEVFRTICRRDKKKPLQQGVARAFVCLWVLVTPSTAFSSTIYAESHSICLL